VCVKALLGFGVAVALLCETAAERAYKFLDKIPIGGEGGWDLVTMDAATRRLYLSHVTKVVIVDLRKTVLPSASPSGRT